jgi:LAO/AO transport system kinase
LKPRTVQDFINGIVSSDRVVLSQAITLLESTRPEHQALAQEVLEACLRHSTNSIRIGITGAPGVGKSTFIEAFGLQAIAKGKQVAVLAIDPSSQVGKGSILGDKTRMAQLSQHENAFIRPSPAGNSLGGVARRTRETIFLCEAAGFDMILVETVGVGQSEIAVRSLVDCFVLLLLPGAGDELQGIKRGIVEMADVLAVNKADGDQADLAKRSQRAYQNALHLFSTKPSGWIPQVLTCSATTGAGMNKIWELIEKFRTFTQSNGFFDRQRREQARHWLYETLETQLKAAFYNDAQVQLHLKNIEQQVIAGSLSSTKGAAELLQLFFKRSESGFTALED